VQKYKSERLEKRKSVRNTKSLALLHSCTFVFFNSILNNKYLHYCGIILAAALFIAPAFVRGVGGSDLVYHLLWVKNFSQQFWQGDIYPRWLMNMNAGAGSPVFFFYPPVAYYFTSMFAFTQSGIPEAWYPICFAAFSALGIGGIFIYKWLYSCYNDRFAAFCGSLIYFFIPYTIYVFHVFLAFTEFFVFAWIPALLYYTKMLSLGKRRAVIGYAVFFALLIMSTIPGTIVNAGLPVLYFLFCSRGNYKNNITPFMTALVLGVGLSAIYWLPMVFDRINVRVGNTDEMWSGFFNYASNFLFFPRNVLHGFATNAIILAALTWMLSFIAYKIWRKIKISESLSSDYKSHSTFWFFIMLLAFFMTSELSKPVWKIIPFLPIIQFPWRFCSYFSFAFPALIASYFLSVKKDKNIRGEFLWFIVCIAIFYSVSLVLCDPKDFSMLQDPARLKIIDSDSEQTKNLKWQLFYYSKNTVITNEYLPIWTDSELLLPPNLGKFAEICADKIKVLQGEAEVQVEKWQPRDIVLDVDSKSAAEIRVEQLYYPYWKADGQGVEYKITPTENNGLINLSLPAGVHKVHLYLDKSPAERYGQIISLISLLILGGYGSLLVGYRKKLAQWGIL
jgi:hypothetical protein